MQTTLMLAAAIITSPQSAVLSQDEVERLARAAVAYHGYNWYEKEVKAMRIIVYRESKYNPTAQNRRSSAFGLYQFLDSTWKSTGIKKTNDPFWQSVAGAKYIKGRYGTPSRVLQLWTTSRGY